eukprot:TRINITY_DN5123_c0_g1_i1.p2 TRINITY_DN5123_c0_g1~~TRINITY_DN5123_c0_g1_i1.p2  ORF type:complete len:125 (-),score=19.27 TRINITY_DN5123_c0_g1_i1:212-586(-)
MNRDYYTEVWLGLFSSESWSDENTNCQQLENLITLGQQDFGNYIGLLSTRDNWNAIFGSSCDKFSIYPIWYIDDNGIASMNDWSSESFGGWRKPTMKQYQTNGQVCGVSVNFDIKDGSAENSLE